MRSTQVQAKRSLILQTAIGRVARVMDPDPMTLRTSLVVPLLCHRLSRKELRRERGARIRRSQQPFDISALKTHPREREWAGVKIYEGHRTALGELTLSHHVNFRGETPRLADRTPVGGPYRGPVSALRARNILAHTTCLLHV
jgi:hypothetical protein